MKKDNNTQIINNKVRNFYSIISFLILSFIFLVFSVLITIYYTIENRKLVITNNSIKKDLAQLDSELTSYKFSEIQNIFISDIKNKSNKYYLRRELDSKYAFIYEQRI
ncbi:MAG: hypothetical protein QM532_04365 [Cyanobium sp. MAG06]|nr:hypothetical protein [Cyanobium sp. MAG06]